MTQEQKDLLLKDLCARLPYGVKVQDELGRIHKLVIGNADLVRLYYNDFSTYSEEKLSLPYLFPLSSMTEEQKQYLKNRFCYDWDGEPYDLWKCQIEIGDVDELIDFFHKNHLDYRGLIEKGLAIDVTGLNIY